jgi:hypothetical protein
MSFTRSGARIVLLAIAIVAFGLIAATAAASVRRPPDVRDAAASAAAPGLTVGRPPDVRDAAAAARIAAAPTASGFHWGDYAVGVGTGIGSALILAGVLAAVAVARRRRVLTA